MPHRRLGEEVGRGPGELFLGDPCMDCLLGFTSESSEAGLLQKVEKLLPQGTV